MTMKIPKFRSDEDAAAFWDTHSFADVARQTAAVNIRFVRKPKQSITIRLGPEDIGRVEEIAKKKGLGYTSLIRQRLALWTAPALP